MKTNIFTSILLSGALLFSATPAFSRHSNGHRGNENRTEKHHDKNRHPGGNKHNRPNGNNHNRPGGKPNGNHHNRPNGNNHNRPGGKPNGNYRPGNNKPGGNSYKRPGGKHHDYKRPPGHHNNWRPTPPPPPGPRPHPRFHGYRPRPSVGINVSFGGVNLFYSNGLYYNRYSPTQYVVTLPPLGMIVSQIFNPVYQWVNNGYYYVSEGVVYAPIQTAYGLQYRVTDYIY